MATKIVLDVLLPDGTRGLISNQLRKSVYSHLKDCLKQTKVKDFNANCLRSLSTS